jgi:hypothetical protein
MLLLAPLSQLEPPLESQLELMQLERQKQAPQAILQIPSLLLELQLEISQA